MNLFACSFLFCGVLIYQVSAKPSAQWVYEQIQPLPNELDVSDVHIKKSKIPNERGHFKGHIHKKKDGVKKLFSFLDAAVEQTESSGSGDSSNADGSSQEKGGALAFEQHSDSAISKYQQSMAHSNQLKTEDQTPSAKEKQLSVSSVSPQQTVDQTSKAGLTGYKQHETKQTGLLSETISPTSDQHLAAFSSSSSHGSSQNLTFSTPQGSIHPGNPGQQGLTYSQNAVSYGKSPQDKSFGDQYRPAVQGKQPQSRYMTSSRHPPPIPVRSQVTANQLTSPQVQHTVQHVFGAPLRSSTQAPYYSSLTVAGPNRYGNFYVSQYGYPNTKGKSAPSSFQSRPYGQLKRQREQFHQQTRTLIPGSVTMATSGRYPISQPQPSLIGQSRSFTPAQVFYNHVQPFASRSPVSAIQRPVMSSLYPGAQAYYSSATPKSQAAFAGTVPLQMQRYGYPLIQQTRVARALLNHKPQPRTLLTSLKAAAARIVAPVRPQTSEEHNAIAAESVSTSSGLPKGITHAVRS